MAQTWKIYNYNSDISVSATRNIKNSLPLPIEYCDQAPVISHAKVEEGSQHCWLDINCWFTWLRSSEPQSPNLGHSFGARQVASQRDHSLDGNENKSSPSSVSNTILYPLIYQRIGKAWCNWKRYLLSWCSVHSRLQHNTLVQLHLPPATLNLLDQMYSISIIRKLEILFLVLVTYLIWIYRDTGQFPDISKGIGTHYLINKITQWFNSQHNIIHFYFSFPLSLI